MCEFISAVKTKDKHGKDKYLFLTYDLIHNTPTGKLLQKKYKGDDLIGHSAIREYFEVRSGHGDNWECTDFSTPKNFPAVIAEAIKRGEFRGFGFPEGLLTPKASEDYQAKSNALYEDYQAKSKAAFWDSFAVKENRAEAWAREDEGVSLQDVRAAADAAADAAYAAADADAAYAAAYAAYAAAYAADAAAYARISVLKECADIVRKFYPEAPIIESEGNVK